MRHGIERTKRPRTRWVKLGLVLLTGATTVYGFSSGPPPAHTGAPGESTCVECHTGSLNSGAGSVKITGVPDAYTPGQEYTITVRTAHPDRRRWGFQLTALGPDGKTAGTFTLTDRVHTRIVNGSGSTNGRVYVEHTESGTFAGQPNGGQWEVSWTAPATDVGRVTFYAAGNAANNNSQSSGDSIYTTSEASGNSAPMVIAPAYKKGKIVLQDNGSNLENGATLDVTNGSSTETFAISLNSKGTKWVVKKSASSTPGGLSVDEAWPAGTTVTLVAHNSDGSSSAPVQASR